MHQRIAIAFRRGRQQEASVVLKRCFQHVLRPGGTDSQRFNGKLQVIARTGRRCHMQHGIERSGDFKWPCNILLLEREARLILQVGDVRGPACGKVI